MSQVLTMKELMEMHPPVKLTHGDRWGNWAYDARNFTLVIKKPTYRSGYEIDLEICTTAGGVLNWIAHMRGKNWMDDKDLADLIRAFHDILDLYELALGQEIGNIKAYLKNRTYIKST